MKMLTFFLICFFQPFLGFNTQIQKQEHIITGLSPEFEFVTLAGEHITSADLKGKIIILDFWSTDCTPCIKSMPQVEEVYRKYKDNPRVAFFLVNSGWETIAKARSFANDKRSSFLIFSWGTKYDLPFAYDQGSKTLKSFGFDSNPSTVIIDSKFRIRLKHSGFIKDMNGFLCEQVDQYLAEQ